MHLVCNAVILGLLCKVEQHRVDGRILAKLDAGIIRQALLVALQILRQRVIIVIAQILLHQRHMVAHIVFGAPRFRNLFLQIVVLQMLHRELVVFLLQFYGFGLFEYQLGYDIIHQARTGVDEKEGDRVAGAQRHLQTGVGRVAVDDIVPHQIKGGGN